MKIKELNLKIKIDKERINRNQLYMIIAQLMSLRGTCGRAQVGCIITSVDGRIVSTGYNGTLRGAPHCTELDCNLDDKCKHSVHAEANAIVFGAKSGISLSGCILYCTMEPCLECAKLIIQSGVAMVIYEGEYTNHEGTELLKNNGIIVEKYEQIEDNNKRGGSRYTGQIL